MNDNIQVSVLILYLPHFIYNIITLNKVEYALKVALD